MKASKVLLLIPSCLFLLNGCRAFNSTSAYVTTTSNGEDGSCENIINPKCPYYRGRSYTGSNNSYDNNYENEREREQERKREYEKDERKRQNEYEKEKERERDREIKELCCDERAGFCCDVSHQTSDCSACEGDNRPHGMCCPTGFCCKAIEEPDMYL